MPGLTVNTFSDYFSIPTTSSFSYQHYSDETPVCSPTITEPSGLPVASPANPLLAYRDTFYPSTPPRASNMMQKQTSAAHGYSPNRPRPTPVQQNVLLVSDESSSSSEDSDITSPPEVMRCSRCQRTPSLDVKTGKSNMVQYGLNLWYCTRCAGLVGLIK